MATSVFVASVEGYTGKSTVALGVLEQLSRRVERVAVYRPVVGGDAARDVLDLLVSHEAGAADLRRVRRRDLRRPAPRLSDLSRLGITVDEDRNTGPVDGPTFVSSDGADVAVLVVPTDEEYEIARQALAVISA